MGKATIVPTIRRWENHRTSLFTPRLPAGVARCFRQSLRRWGRSLLVSAEKARAASGSAFAFKEVEAGVDADHHVAEGYDANVLLRWGDALFVDSPAFDPKNQTAEAQRRQFGYNNDYVGYIPLNGSSEHGLLVVNHEYTNPHLMFPGLVTIADGKIKQAPLSQAQVDIEMAAHGGTIVEIRKVDGKWRGGAGRPISTAASPRRPRCR